MFSLVLGVGFAVLYLCYRRRDRRLLRNGLFLVGAVWFLLTGALTLLTPVLPWLGWVNVALLLLAPLGLLALAAFLISNGVIIIRREGLRLANALSLVAGLAAVMIPLALVALVLSRQPAALVVAALLFVVTGYVGIAFVVFLVYSLIYARSRIQSTPAALVILGSRLIDGAAPPLLRSRLDKAVALYQQTQDAGHTPPILIPSGGRGPDESRPEGEAMAEYLIAQGVDPADIHPETAARNTRDNLLYARTIQQQADRPGLTLAVTNNYHVLRAAILARSIGTSTQVIGSPTAAYYVPSAFLREFVAVLVEHRILHTLLALTMAALTLIAVIATQQQV